MDVKFILRAECRADNIDKKRTAEETAEMITNLLEDWCGIKANVEVTDMTYIHESEEQKRCDTCRHMKEPWFNRCADCLNYDLWEKKE